MPGTRLHRYSTNWPYWRGLISPGQRVSLEILIAGLLGSIRSSWPCAGSPKVMQDANTNKRRLEFIASCPMQCVSAILSFFRPESTKYSMEFTPFGSQLNPHRQGVASPHSAASSVQAWTVDGK